LDKLEIEQSTLTAKIEETDREIESALIERPTAALVQEVWGRINEIWKVLSHDERGDLMKAFVQKVEMTDKERVTLELLPYPTSHAHWFALSSNLGAGVGLEPTTFGL